MRRRNLIVLLVVVVLCGSGLYFWNQLQAFQQGWIPIEKENLPAGVPTGYAKRWIKSDPCAPPCWEGITPGKTSLQEAIDLLNQNPGIISGSVVARPPGNSSGFLIWDWVGSDKGGEGFYSVDEQIIIHIRPIYEYLPGSSPSFTLEELIEHFGEPSHISTYAFSGLHGDGPFYILEVFYADLGISVEQRGLYRVEPIISPKMRFDQVYFNPLPFDPSAYSKEWQGIKNFEDYCQASSRNSQSFCPYHL